MSFDDEPTRMSPRVPQPPPGQPQPPAGAPREPHPPSGPRTSDMGAVPPGAVPPGAVPPGAVPPGAVPPGTPVAWPQDPRVTAIEERLSSLRTALYAFAAVAVVALGLAFWALLAGDDSDSGATTRGGASTSALRERVSKLEDRIGGRATKGDVNEVSQEVAALSKRVAALPTTPTTTTPNDDGDAVDPAEVASLKTDVQQLQQQVQTLEQAAAAAGGDTSGDATTTP